MKKLHLLLTALATVAVMVPATASAVEYGGIGGRPANPQAGNPRTQSIFVYQLKLGQQVTDGVTVYNNTDKQQTVAVYAVDSALSSGGAFSCAQAADPKKDVGSWVKLETESVTLAAHSSQTVPFTVAVPSSAGVGEHDGCIATQAASASTSGGRDGGVVLSFRSAIRVAITIPGKIVKKLSVSNVTVGKLQNSNYQVTPVVQNDGNVSLDTTIQVNLVSMYGARQTAPKGVYPILPHSKASWNFEFKRPFWGGWYRAQAVATYNNNPATGIGLGQNDNQETQTLSSTRFFIAPAPQADLVYAGAVLVVAGVLALMVRSRLRKRHVKRHWKSFVIEEGDTLESLAKDFHTSWKAIAKANKLKPPYNLRKGQKLKLPVEKE